MIVTLRTGYVERTLPVCGTRQNKCSVLAISCAPESVSMLLAALCFSPTNWFRTLFHIRWPRISLQFFANDQLFYIFVYYTSLHVSSITVLIIRRSNCINTSSGMTSLCAWLLGLPVRRELQFPLDRHTKQSLIQTNHTRWCINTIRSPDDEHCDARNM
jgi:hypothetical protein